MSIPHDVFAPQPQPPQKSNTCLILGLIFGGFGGFVLICGGCCIGTMFYGLGQLESETRAALSENEVIQERIGEIQTCDMDWMASMQKSGQGEEDTFVFDVAGDKGKGKVVAFVLQAGDDFYIDSGTLTMEGGESFDLIAGTEVNEESQTAPDAPAEPQASEQDNKFTAKVQAALSENAVLAERIGDIQSFTYDIVQSTDERGSDVFVFHVTGSKASGKLRAECITDAAKTEQVTSAELILDDGESVQLFPDKPLQ